MLNRKDMNILMALNGKRIFILAMLGRGFRLADIAYTLGYSQGWATTEKDKIERAFKEDVFYRAQSTGVVKLTEYGKKLSNICNNFIDTLLPDLGELKVKPTKGRDTWL